MDIVHLHLEDVKKHQTNKKQLDLVTELLKTTTNAQIYLVMPAYLDMQKKQLEKRNGSFNKDKLDLNTVEKQIAKFKLWLQTNYLNMTKTDGVMSTLNKLILQWGKDELPDYTSNASEFEKALRRLSMQDIGEGLEQGEALEYQMIAKDLEDHWITCPAKSKNKQAKRDVVAAATEIKAAARILMEQIDIRFPELEVLGSFKLFEAGVDINKLDKSLG